MAAPYATLPMKNTVMPMSTGYEISRDALMDNKMDREVSNGHNNYNLKNSLPKSSLLQTLLVLLPDYYYSGLTQPPMSKMTNDQFS